MTGTIAILLGHTAAALGRELSVLHGHDVTKMKITFMASHVTVRYAIWMYGTPYMDVWHLIWMYGTPYTDRIPILI